MKRNSIKKASTFKLQAARSKFNEYLANVQSSVVATKFPELTSSIKQTSETVYNMVYTFKEDSPFLRGLNYDQKQIGFSSSDNTVTYREYLPGVSDVYLMGDFNSFNKTSHKLLHDEDNEGQWFKIDIDTNIHHLTDGSRVMLRVIDKNGAQSHMIPPCCHVIDDGYGIFRRSKPNSGNFSKFRITNLLAYTIDLAEMPLQKCGQYICKEEKTLECFNTVILKNLFKGKNGALYKFALTYKQQEQLAEIIRKLSDLGVKTVLQWNFQPIKLQYEGNAVQQSFLRPAEHNCWQFDLRKQIVIAYYLANISHFYRSFGIGGVHFTNVGSVCQVENGVVLLKCINLLSERMADDAITLASSKEFVPGLTEAILDGGLGFSFTYNYHQSLSLSEKHCYLLDSAKQIHIQSNCLSVDFKKFNKKDYIYLLLAFLISKKGLFTRGPFDQFRQDLQKVLKLRRQEQLFSEECSILKMDEKCAMIKRGKETVIFNFTNEQEEVSLAGAQSMEVLFNEVEQEVRFRGEKFTIAPMNCLLLEEN